MVKTWFLVIAVIALAALAAAYFMARNRAEKLLEEISFLERNLQRMQDRFAETKVENKNLADAKKQLEDSMQARIAKLEENVDGLKKENERLGAENAGLVAKVLELEAVVKKAAASGDKAVEQPADSDVFDEEKLHKAAKNLLEEAGGIYREAMKLTDNEKRDEQLDKALKTCDEAIEKLDKIAKYYEKHQLLPSEGAIWDWEKTLQDASELKMYIVRDRGF